MQQTKLKSGDRVRSKAGGPIMAAERVDYEVWYPYARCVWFDERALAHFGNFMITALERLEPDETSPDRPG